MINFISKLFGRGEKKAPKKMRPVAELSPEAANFRRSFQQLMASKGMTKEDMARAEGRYIEEMTAERRSVFQMLRQLTSRADRREKFDSHPVTARTVGSLPVRGGRSVGSVTPTDISSLTGTGISSRPLDREQYDRLYQLARDNHDVSFAVDNIMQLGNTKLNIEFDTSVSPAQSAQMHEELHRIQDSWYAGGMSMLVNALLRQVYITGAVSAEAQPTPQLNGVGRVVLLSPKWVIFRWNEEINDYEPFQENVVGAWFVGWTPLASDLGYAYHKLNEHTYKYIAIARDEDKPYAIPPLLSALEMTCIEDDMLENLSAITKRLGLLGFLEVIVNAPSRQEGGVAGQGETDDEYQARVQDYLAEVEQEVEFGLSNGYVIGVKQLDPQFGEVKTEFNLRNSTADSGGAKGLFDLVTQMKSAGLKQDPVFLGKNFSTTESLAKVLIIKFAAQIQNYQDAVAQFLQHAYNLHLRLRGYSYEWLQVTFEQPILQDNKVQYEGLMAKFNYYKAMKDQNLIDQQQFANFMGLDAPAGGPPQPDSEGMTGPVGFEEEGKKADR